MTTSITPAQAGAGIISAYMEQEQDEQSLTSALNNLKGMSPDEALVALMYLMGQHTMVVQQDEVNIDSQNLNMMTALGQISTRITNDFNGISPSNPIASGPGSNQALAADIIAQCNALQAALQPDQTTLSWTNPVTHAQEDVTWMSSTMASQTLDALNSFENLIGMSGGEQNMVNTINGWINNPTTPTGPGSPPTGPTGQEQIQSVDTTLATLSNTFSGLSQTASNVVKEQNTILTQYQSALASLCTTIDSLNKATVANSRGS